MSDQLTKNLFKQLNLSENEQKVFEFLSSFGKATVANIAKETAIKKTTCYRIVEGMDEHGILEQILEDSTTYYKLASFDSLKLIIEEKKDEIEALVGSLPELESTLFTPETLANTGVQVKVYRSTEGIKQIMWNMLKTKGIIYGVSNKSMLPIVGEKYLEKWIDEINSRGTIFKYIIQKETNVRDEANHPNLLPLRTKYNKDNVEQRFCPESLLKITHKVVVYDDVVVFYNLDGEEVNGIEVISDKIAETMRQFIVMLWEQLEK